VYILDPRTNPTNGVLNMAAKAKKAKKKGGKKKAAKKK
jgi:hypothetical protein